MNTYYCDVVVICVSSNTYPKWNAFPLHGDTYQYVFPYLGNISLVICSPTRETHITSDMCSPTCETQITSDMCSPTCETQITSDMCSPTWETHITGDVCSPTWETHTTTDICSPIQETHITSDMCLPALSSKQLYIWVIDLLSFVSGNNKRTAWWPWGSSASYWNSRSVSQSYIHLTLPLVFACC